MDFFESQDLARKKTKWLIFLFVLAVLAIIAAIFAIAVVVFALATKASGSEVVAVATDWRFIGAVVFAVLSVVGTGSATKMYALRNGGSAVASLMGGRRIVGNSRKLTDRKVSNVVEEMALASGTPVPPVYILDKELGINAFAAGYTVDDAVIGINRGTAEQLTREELQGVVAHEFSHILNGDMRMSLRMVAILNGILLISLIGGQMLSLLGRTSHYSSRQSNSGKGAGGKVILLIIAAGLFAVGSIGLFFGRMIKSTISRQREYLADASAVQFTRMPDGIAGALKMIGGVSEHSYMKSGNAEEISHMFFGASKTNLLFATHPPLLKRIRRIDEGFDGDFKKFVVEHEKRRRRFEQHKPGEEEKKKKRAFDFLPGVNQFDKFDKMKFLINPVVLIAGIGIPTTEDVEFSELMVNEIPADMLHAVRETFSARCVVFASLLHDDPAIFNQQMAIVEKLESPGTVEMTLQARKMHENLPTTLRLAVFEIIQGTLSAMSPSQYPVFRKTVNELIMADQKVDLFEFFLSHHLIVHLDRCFHPQPKQRNLYKTIANLKPEIGRMLSVLVCAGHTNENEQREVFNSAFATILPDGTSADEFFVPNWDHRQLSSALKKVVLATPAVKKQVLSAAVLVISNDNILTVQEVELFRAMSESLDCPVPPLAATHEKAPQLPNQMMR